MNIIVGHTNMDLDCLGSMVMARTLHPSYRLVRRRLIQPVARNLYNLYQNHLDFLTVKDLEDSVVEKILVVDTRSSKRIKEFLDVLNKDRPEIEIFDHHPADSSDLEGAVIHQDAVGANTTLVGIEVMQSGLPLSPEDATIALTGIYADTGNFTHENVTDADFRVASYCLKYSASVKLVRAFLQTLREEHQITLFHDLLNGLVYRDIHGHMIILSYMELEKKANGLSAVVEKVFEIENPDAMFAVFAFKKENQSLIVARSQREIIDLNELLEVFGGGGHTMAASALLKGIASPKVFEALEKYLDLMITPAIIADQIMSPEVSLIHNQWTLLDASKFPEEINHTGAPVVNDRGEPVGFMSLRDIMKGRRAQEMHAPVRAYMTRKAISGQTRTTVREIADLFFDYNIGHLPIVDGKRVIGIVTRTDYLDFIEKRKEEGRKVLRQIEPQSAGDGQSDSRSVIKSGLNLQFCN